MAADNFDGAFAAVIKHEGGYVDLPADTSASLQVSCRPDSGLDVWASDCALRQHHVAIYI